MEYYIANAKLLHKTVLIKELSFKSYRNLLKCLIDENISKKILFKNFNQIILETTDLSISDITSLTYIDYLLLLIYIRAYSFSDALTLQLQEEDQQPFNINLSLNDTIEYLHEQILLLQPFKAVFNDIVIELQLPSINDIYNIRDSFQVSIFYFFIKSIKTKNDIIEFSQLSNNNKDIVIENLPTNIFSLIKQKIEILIKELNKLNFFETISSKEFNKQIPILPDWSNIFYILRFIYNNSLENVYDYIYILTKIGNFSSEYLDKCTPGEVFLYIKKLEESYSKTTVNEPKQNMDFSDSSLENEPPFDNLPPVNIEKPTADF